MKLLLRMALSLFLFSCGLTLPAGAQSETAPAPDAEQLQQANDALIQLLENPDSRAALIDLLKKSDTGSAQSSGDGAVSADGAGTGQSAPADESSNSSTSENFALRIGEYTRALADDVGVLVQQTLRSLNGLTLIARGDIPVKWDRLKEISIQVGVVLLAAYAAFWVCQLIAARIYPRMAVLARYGGGLTRSLILILSSILDGITVAVGWAVGNTVALLAYGGFQTGVTLPESLALNAFFILGMANVSLRFIFAPGRPELRILPFDNDSSLYWYSRLRLFMHWIIYGIFLVVPIANIGVAIALGNALRFLTVFFGMIYLAFTVHRNRDTVRKGAIEYAGGLQSALGQRALISLGRLWHIVAYIYLFTVFAIWVTRPFDAMTIIVRATGLSILTIMAGFAISLVVTKAIKGGIRLPEDLNRTLPALQHRLNAFVPRLLKLVRAAVFLGTVLLLLEIWGVLSFASWMFSEAGVDLLSAYGSAFLVLLVFFGIWLAVMSWVDLRLQSRGGNIVTARERTLFQLFRNASTVVIIVMALLLSLSEVGVDIGPLIAGAGVVGLAISFGAQTLVKDIITGAFIQIENAINEGDVVTVAGVTGTVEGITVRSVRMRDLNGTSHIIPFSSVDMVSNFMRGFSYHVALIGVSYDTDISEAKDAMHEAFRRLNETDYGPKIFEDLEMHGVTNFGASSIDIRARIKTTPGDQWSIGRAYNEFVKQVFDERGIEIPFPQVTYHAATPPYAPDQASKKKAPKQVEKPQELSEDAPADDGEH
ncbi:mechanosensitive ion channel [Roseibium denhamense]|uniref:Small conductance mechanosensitive channel n=1 Tax=Roseibium denhamense TaxID=76305 RepID=A0ABY1NJQ0_9HYPH|nr:mechanosensitive ion channel domain-containing protein [Roseibium denhamense]MTI06735.1 mechanosensitive ion channel [Roseibium denhamense]SMP10748.1 small conductance mechanosensitive channel [Roseibium denhamense]